MSFVDKVTNAKETNWVTEGFSNVDVKTTVELAKISAQIERCRIDMHMTQKEFADYMGVTQGMVSKWESREYNFTIKTLNEICAKLKLEASVCIEKPCAKSDYTIIKWDLEKVVNRQSKDEWVKSFSEKGAIA